MGSAITAQPPDAGDGGGSAGWRAEVFGEGGAEVPGSIV
jgi:hypothetical protein